MAQTRKKIPCIKMIVRFGVDCRGLTRARIQRQFCVRWPAGLHNRLENVPDFILCDVNMPIMVRLRVSRALSRDSAQP
jgi:CheY-like chemotaxis protein